jgi:hypothetical protein
LPVDVGGCTAGEAVPASGAWGEASLSAATKERSGVSDCVSAPSREIAFDAAEVVLVFEESLIAGENAETTETGADAGADADLVGVGSVGDVVGSVGGMPAPFPEDPLLVPPVPVPGELEALPPAGPPADEEDGGVEPAGAPADEEDGGVDGVGLVEGSSSPEDDPPVEEESSEEGDWAELSALSSLTPSSEVLAESRPSPSSKVPPDEGGTVAGVVVADFVSEASSSPDDHEEVEGEALLEVDEDDADVLSLPVELPLVFGLSPVEPSAPVSADEPDAAAAGE